MEDYQIGLIIACVAAVFWVINTYNRFIKYRNLIEENWSGIDVALKRRFNLLPNLITAVKGYREHEAGVLQDLTTQRQGSTNMATRSAEESEISKSLTGLLAVAEEYPDLKASDNFLSLQTTLDQIEAEIQKARDKYNTAVRSLNTMVEQFPSNIIARIFNFTRADYFSLELATQRTLPEVEF